MSVKVAALEQDVDRLSDVGELDNVSPVTHLTHLSAIVLGTLHQLTHNVSDFSFCSFIVDKRQAAP